MENETYGKVTDGFQLFMKDTNGIGSAFMEAVVKLSENGSLDKKTQELAYIAVLVTSKMYGGLPFHMAQAKKLGATFEEVKSAVLVPLPILGLQVAEALPYVYETFSDLDHSAL